MKTRLFTIHALTGLHCGVGQGINDIDLPTARDPVSGHPVIPGSSIKGVLRDHLLAAPPPDCRAILEAAFGKDGKESIDFASGLAISDARLVCLPVRSYRGTFAYLSSPYALTLMRRNLLRCGFAAAEVPEIPVPAGNEDVAMTATEDSALTHKEFGGCVLLEDLDVPLDEGGSGPAGTWAELIADFWIGKEDAAQRDLFARRFAVASDNLLDFLCESSLPVIARNALNEQGTVRKGALWYEEQVPAEAIFAGVFAADDVRQDKTRHEAAAILDAVTGSPLEVQLGGKASIGRGFVEIRFSKGGAA